MPSMSFLTPKFKSYAQFVAENIILSWFWIAWTEVKENKLGVLCSLGLGF